ncbi:MAG: glycosyltransferase family 2 protein [Desulfobulbaceae bacterium]|nr:glycosyltransferase family 2 protein [Desulfobulbaceae bacterium]
MSNFVLVTPAHNEEDVIGQTIESVIKQKRLPLKWVIVSDRSTDGTDEIIKKYEKQYAFIKFLRRDEGAGRDTAAKVATVNKGLEYLKQFDYDFIGNLDADITFEPDYFDRLIDIFAKNPNYGIIGGRIYHEANGRMVEHNCAIESVPGAVQFFRRECWEQIGGYLPLKGGFEDSVAELSARYHGWTTLSIKGLKAIHLREIGTVNRSIWKARFNDGINEYIYGYKYYYHLLRLLYYLPKKPVLLGSLVVFAGYLYALLTRRPKIVPPELMAHHHQEQWERVRERFFARRPHA